MHALFKCIIEEKKYFCNLEKNIFNKFDLFLLMVIMQNMWFFKIANIEARQRYIWLEVVN